MSCDISDHTAVQRLSERVLKNVGRIDLLIDNGQVNHLQNVMEEEPFVQHTSECVLYFLNVSDVLYDPSE